MMGRAVNADSGCGRTLDEMLPAGAGRCLFLSMRHMGDALIWSAFLRTLRSARPGLEIDILGRRQLRAVFEASCGFDRYIEIDLPLYGHHRRGSSDIWRALRTLAAVRRRRYDACMNLLGDFRENLIGMLSGARWNIAPVWAEEHPFRHKMRAAGASGLANTGIEIPAAVENYYDSLEFMAAALGMPPIQWRVSGSAERAVRCSAKRIGLHPGASHPSRRWPTEKWKQLMQSLAAEKYALAIFCAPDESARIRDEYAEQIRTLDIEVVAEDTAGFLQALARVDVLAGMDSFSAHAAYACGVASVVLHGSSPAIMTPPGAACLSAGAQCPHFPCYYSYPCRGTAGEYICSRGIEGAEVLSAVDALAKRP
jgi:heptosyltransferase III